MLSLSVLTPLGPALEEAVDEVSLPGVSGEFTALPGHIPLLSAIQAGTLSYRRGHHSEKMHVGPGYAEVDANGTVIVLVQEAHK